MEARIQIARDATVQDCNELTELESPEESYPAWAKLLLLLLQCHEHQVQTNKKKILQLLKLE